MLFHVSGTSLLFGPGGVFSNVNYEPPVGGSPITPSLRISHVPNGSPRQSTYAAADGSTTITGTAPLLLFMDAGATRCVDTANDEISAWWDLGFYMNYGYGYGQTWGFYGEPYDYDYGEPLFARVVESSLTTTFQLEVWNADGYVETRQFTVIATEPPAPTIIEVAAGAWPTWVSGTHYALRAGGDYTAFGEMQMGGHYDIIVSKVGAGADPYITRFNPDSRSIAGTSTVLAPSRNIRLVDIDVGVYYNGAMGPQFCGCVRGRVRSFESDAFGYIYDNAANTEAERANTRIPRGLFLWKTGVMNPPSGSQYVMITSLRESAFQGVDFVKNGATGNHALRNYGRDLIYRHSRIYATVSSASLVKHQAGNGVDPWTDADDAVGSVTGPKTQEARPASRFVMSNMVYHTATSVIPDICVGAGAENNEIGYGHGSIELAAFSDSVSAENTWQSVADLDVQVNGRGHSTRNVRLQNGTYVTQSAGAYVNNIPPGMNGPYRYETVNTRPRRASN